MDNKRITILLIIALCLVIVQLILTFTASLKDVKYKHKINSAVPRQATPAISRIRGGNAGNDSGPVIPENKRVMLTYYDIPCKYCIHEEVDFSQEVALDSIINTGELMKCIASVRNYKRIPDIKYYLVEKKSDGRIALINAEYCEGYSPLHIWNYKGFNSLFDQLDQSEIMLSMFFNRESSRIQDPLPENLYHRINKLRNTLNNEYIYRIFIDPVYCEQDSLIEIKGEKLKFLLECRSKRNTPEIVEAIVWDDEIHYKLKKDFSERYIAAFFYKDNTLDPLKEKYFKFLLKIIVNADLKETQNAMNTALGDYKNRENFNAADLIDFFDDVIDISKCPEIVLNAYYFKTEFYLEMGKIESATQLALKALNLYDKLYLNEAKNVINFSSASACINHVMITEDDPRVIRKYIETYENAASKSEFNNYLLYVKAVLTELMDSSIEETIAAYERINIDELGGYDNVANYINRLKEVKEEIVEIDETVIAKKFLLSKDTITLNKSGTMDINIIQKELSPYASRLTSNQEFCWYKAKIGDEIYWYKTHNMALRGDFF